MGGGGARGGGDVILDRAGPAVGDVGAHRVVEQADLLADQRDGAAQAGERDAANVLPVDGEASGRDIVEPWDQIEHGRLSRARRADQRHGLAPVRW